MEVESAGAVGPSRGAIFGETISVWRERSRRELGITAEAGTTVTGAGHQAYLWHAGILAKFVHARRLAGASGVVVHLVVDHDAYEPGLVRVPMRRPGDPASLQSLTHRFAPSIPGRAALVQPSFDPQPFERVDTALPSVGEGLHRAQLALAAERAHAANAPMQVAAALSTLMRPWVGATQCVAASRLLATSLGHAIIESMRRDPMACARAFNEALKFDPRAARPLRIDDDPELPLWTIGADGARERVTASRLAAASRDGSWLPRAFLLSAIMRLGVCDRFVHGTGARRYERVTEAWWRSWLGIELPPIDIASATLRLPLAELGDLDAARMPQELRALSWNPEALDSATTLGAGVTQTSSGNAEGRRVDMPGPRKQAMLAEIARQPRRSPERRRAYRQMLETLAILREERRPELERIAAFADTARASAQRRAVATDRTWPFVYFEAASLDAAFGATSSGASTTASGSGR